MQMGQVKRLASVCLPLPVWIRQIRLAHSCFQILETALKIFSDGRIVRCLSSMSFIISGLKDKEKFSPIALG